MRIAAMCIRSASCNAPEAAAKAPTPIKRRTPLSAIKALQTLCRIAKRNADHFIARCPGDFTVPWDFDVPAGPDRIADSSAAAIAASGLWNLAELTFPVDPAGSARYRSAALNLLASLLSATYVAWNTPGWEGVLKHGVYHFHKKLGVDESVMWGEFFFLEAVDKVLKSTG